MKVLIVGAGAVGQAYALHLKNAGAEVYFYVKEKYREAYNGPLPYYFLNKNQSRHKPEYFSVNGVLTNYDQVSNIKWDQIYLCMSSTGLRGEWLKQFSLVVRDATIIVLQPGIEDRGYVLNFFPETQIVMGMISLISYFAPLPGEVVPVEGLAYWLPPMSPGLYSGEDIRVKAVVDLLNAGGQPSKQVESVIDAVTVPAAALLTLVLALEKADWSFEKMKSGDYLKDACDATLEVVRIGCRKQQIAEPMSMKFVRPMFVRMIMNLAPKILPLDIETYLKVHFTKINDQTRLHMQDFLRAGNELGLPTKALQRII